MHEQNNDWNERLELKTHSNLSCKHYKAFIVVKSKQASHIYCTKVFSSLNTKEHARQMKYQKLINQSWRLPWEQ